MRRIALRGLRRDDEGLSLVETVVALLVFGLIGSALASGIIFATKTSYTARTRQLATTLAQQTIETNRTIGVGGLAICSSSNPPATYTGSQSAYSGKSVVTSAVAGCLQYQQTVPSHGVTFTVTNWVLSMNQATSVAGFVQYEKALIVTVAWSTPSPGGSYTANTLVQNGTNSQAAGVSTNPTILTINAQYNDATSGWTNIKGSQQDGNYFDVTVSDNNGPVASGTGTTGEGTWSTSLIPQGSYTCSVTEETSLRDTWTANATQPANEVVSADGYTVTWPCTVTDQQTTTYATYWTGATGSGTTASTCTVSNKAPAGTKLDITVYDAATQGSATPTAINAVPVSISNGASGEGTPPGAKNSTKTGLVDFGMAYIGPVYFSATPAGDPPAYDSSGQIGPICVLGGQVNTYTVWLNAAPSPLTSDSQVIVTVTNNDSQPIKKYQVTVSNSSYTATGNIAVPSSSSVGTSYDQGSVTLVVPNGSSYTTTVCVVQADSGCNVIQTWTNQSLTDSGGGAPGGHSYILSASDDPGGLG